MARSRIATLMVMMCGTHPVSNDNELCHEVCADATTYADANYAEAFASAIADMLNLPTRADALRQRGLERANLFT